jgi:hypothetical protein
MGTTADSVQIPGKAVSEETDLREPVRALLEDLSLLAPPDEADDAKGFAAALKGPPQSVALIEAGATAASKWWAAGLGAFVIPLWGSVATWYSGEADSVKVTLVGGALLATSALIIAIGILIASDVRGRAAAAVSLIEARATVATEMVQAARAVYQPTPATLPIEIVPLPRRIPVKNHLQPGPDEDGWHALAIERHPDGNRYLIVKGSSEETVPASKLEFST